MPNIFDVIAGAPQGSGLLSDEDRRTMRRQGLLTLGTSLLRQAQPTTGVPVGLAAGIGTALEEAQAGGFRGLQLQDALRQRVLGRRKQEVMARYAGATDPESLSMMFRDLVALGDYDAAQAVAGVIKTMGETSGAFKVQAGIDPETGKPWLYRIGAAGLPQSLGIAPPDEESKTFERVARLASQYGSATREHALTSDAYRKILAAVDVPSAAGDVSLIFGYMKMIDPGSVVREGEFATAANTGSIPVRIWGIYNKALTGERLTEPQRADFLSQAHGIAKGMRESMDEHIKDYTERAAEFALPYAPFDYFRGLDIPGYTAPGVAAPGDVLAPYLEREGGP